MLTRTALQPSNQSPENTTRINSADSPNTTLRMRRYAELEANRVLQTPEKLAVSVALLAG